MDTLRHAKRRLAGLASLKALITSASIVAVLGGWGLISVASQNAQADAGETPAATTPSPTQTAPLETTGRTRPRPGHDFFGAQPGFTNPGQAPGTQSTLPRTRSSQ